MKPKSDAQLRATKRPSDDEIRDQARNCALIAEACRHFPMVKMVVGEICPFAFANTICRWVLGEVEGKPPMLLKDIDNLEEKLAAFKSRKGNR